MPLFKFQIISSCPAKLTFHNLDRLDLPKKGVAISMPFRNFMVISSCLAKLTSHFDRRYLPNHSATFPPPFRKFLVISSCITKLTFHTILTHVTSQHIEQHFPCPSGSSWYFHRASSNSESQFPQMSLCRKLASISRLSGSSWYFSLASPSHAPCSAYPTPFRHCSSRTWSVCVCVMVPGPFSNVRCRAQVRHGCGE